MSTAKNSVQPLSGKKWWLQLCQVWATWVWHGKEDIAGISSVTVYKALKDFIFTLQLVEKNGVTKLPG